MDMLDIDWIEQEHWKKESSSNVSTFQAEMLLSNSFLIPDGWIMSEMVQLQLHYRQVTKAMSVHYSTQFKVF